MKGPVEWPVRSPDLNLMDFFLQGYLRTLAYSSAINNLVDSRQRIENRCQTIRDGAGILANVGTYIRRSMIRKCECCMQVEKRHIEHTF